MRSRGAWEGLGRPSFCFGGRVRRRQNTWSGPAPCHGGHALAGVVVVTTVLRSSEAEPSVLDLTHFILYFRRTLIWRFELDGMEVEDLENY